MNHQELRDHLARITTGDDTPTHPALPLADVANMRTLEACAPIYGLTPHDETTRHALVDAVEALSWHVHRTLSALAETLNTDTRDDD